MSSQQESWNERLKQIASCPACQTSFEFLTTQVVETYSEAQLVHITCSKCRHALLAVIASLPDSTQTVGLVTDLTYEDVLRFSQAESISIKDVMDVHDYFGTKEWVKSFMKNKPKRRVKKQ
jgi:hypothetical protein